MAADFVQDLIVPDLPDISVTYNQDKIQKMTDDAVNKKMIETGDITTYCGEIVKPGVGPGVLIGNHNDDHPSKSQDYLDRSDQSLEELD